MNVSANPAQRILVVVMGTHHTPAEIGNLQLSLQANEQVFRLDIPMNDVLAVQVL